MPSKCRTNIRRNMRKGRRVQRRAVGPRMVRANKPRKFQVATRKFGLLRRPSQFFTNFRRFKKVRGARKPGRRAKVTVITRRRNSKTGRMQTKKYAANLTRAQARQLKARFIKRRMLKNRARK